MISYERFERYIVSTLIYNRLISQFWALIIGYLLGFGSFRLGLAFIGLALLLLLGLGSALFPYTLLSLVYLIALSLYI